MNRGYIKQWRKELDSQAFTDPDPFVYKFWSWLKLNASYQSGGGLSPGQIRYGRKEAAARLKVTESKLYRTARKLVSWGMITLSANNRFTTVTICNWQTYQTADPTERTTTEQRFDKKTAPLPQKPNNEKSQRSLLETGGYDDEETVVRTTSEQRANNERTLYKEIRSKKEEEDPPISPQGERNGRPQPLAATDDYSPGFETFWKSYPATGRKKKSRAWASYKRARAMLSKRMGVRADGYLASRARAYALSEEGRGRYVRNTETWLNQQGWEDAPEAWSRPQDSGPRSSGGKSKYEL